MKTILLLCCGFSLATLAAPFANLDFESPNIRAVLASNVIGAPVRVADAIPKWSFQIGQMDQQSLLFNSVYLSSAGGSFEQSTIPARGKYSFVMTAGPLPENSGGPPLSASLYQTGTVPVGARSLLFEAGLDFGTLDVSLGSSLSPIVDLGAGPSGFRAYGIDATAWANKEAELRFTLSPGVKVTFGIMGLDNIRFSPVALVPEPATWALLGVGGALLWATRQPRQRP